MVIFLLCCFRTGHNYKTKLEDEAALVVSSLLQMLIQLFTGFQFLCSGYNPIHLSNFIQLTPNFVFLIIHPFLFLFLSSPSDLFPNKLGFLFFHPEWQSCGINIPNFVFLSHGNNT